jgi:hypothetical protein
MANMKEITNIVVNGFKEEKSDNVILKEMYDAGVDFDDIKPTFNKILKEKGLRLSNKERKEKTNELMEGTESIADAEEALKIVSMLQEKLNVKTTKAMGSLRVWAKANGVELPKTPKASKARKAGFGGMNRNILNHILEIKANGGDVTKEAALEFCHENKIPDAYATHAMNVVHFAKQWNGELPVEVETQEEAQEEAA